MCDLFAQMLELLLKKTPMTSIAAWYHHCPLLIYMSLKYQSYAVRGFGLHAGF
jgi:hypothetical protein